MDVLTPATTWSAQPPTEPRPPEAPVEALPLLQRMAMGIMVVTPMLGLVVAIALLWHAGAGRWRVGWPELLVLIGTYALAGFGVTIGYHRLLTHRSFETSRPVQLLLAVLGSAAGQGMVIRWVATHRRHHQQSDRPGDPHSPHLHGHGLFGTVRGFWHAHLGWAFDADKPNLARSVPDLLANQGMLWVDRLYILWVAVGMLLPAMLLGIVLHSWRGFAAGLLWGGLVRICLMQHVTWSVNSVCHIWGSRPFTSSDYSTNNLPVAIVSLGEGWHNNHHAFPTSARHGLQWWQFDPSYLIIRSMKRLHLAWNIRLPTAAAMASKAV